MRMNGQPVYKGPGKPVNLYQGPHKIAGWRWNEQTGVDMPFERTYNDRVGLSILGKSKQTQTLQGKNLIDVSKVQNTRADTTGVWDGETLSVTGLWFCMVAVVVQSNTDYYIKAVRGGESIYPSISVFNEGSGLTGADLVKSIGAGNGTFNSGSNKRVRVLFYCSNSSLGIQTATFSQIQLEAGTAATPYESFTPNSPSPAYPSPIILSVGDVRVEGRNLFDKSHITLGKAYNSSGLLVTDANFSITEEMDVQGFGSIAISGISVTGRYLKILDSSRNMIILGNSMNRVLNIPANGKYAVFSIPIVDIDRVQIERGSNAHQFTPYRPILTMPIPELRAIPDGAGGWIARDELYVERGGGEWHLMRRQRAYSWLWTGSGTWVLAVRLPTVARFYISPTRLSVGNANQTAVRSDRFVASGATIDAEGVVLSGTGLTGVKVSYARLGLTSAATDAELVAALKSWLSTHNTVVVYQLATPIVTDLGPIDLPSYYPYTRVLVSGDYPPDVTATCKVVDG